MLITHENTKFRSVLHIPRTSALRQMKVCDVDVLLKAMTMQPYFENAIVNINGYTFRYRKSCKGKTYHYFIDSEEKKLLK